MPLYLPKRRLDAEMNKTELGQWGEKKAAEMLERKGYRIVARNYRCRLGEIDIIARKESILAFVEVKLRKNSASVEAREYVTISKQKKIRLTAENYLALREWTQRLQPRFDVVEVYAPMGAEGDCRLNHLENAFE